VVGVECPLDLYSVLYLNLQILLFCHSFIREHLHLYPMCSGEASHVCKVPSTSLVHSKAINESTSRSDTLGCGGVKIRSMRRHPLPASVTYQ
jgi:hypothetical protein